jgi:hypothetical protein
MDLEFDDVADYARRPGDVIYWQGFTSTTANITVAYEFEGNVLLMIIPVDPSAGTEDLSFIPVEQEFVISPYQGFYLRGVAFDDVSHRWIIELVGMPSPSPKSWLHPDRK